MRGGTAPIRVFELQFRHFRGFDSIKLLPSRHACIVGEPGAGRSDLIDGLSRVLSADFIRTSRAVTELDFYDRDISKRAEIEVVLGELGPQLEQVFFDHLEVWDRNAKKVVDELSDAEEIERENYDFVVRLCYRAVWNEDEGQADHWIDYPKASDPDAGMVERVRRSEREALQFAAITARGRVLDLGATGTFRKLVEGIEGKDFLQAMENLEERIGEAATGFAAATQVSTALERILAPLRISLRLSEIEAERIIQFLPEGGSISGVMRSLAPAIDLQDSVGLLPLHRHGSTLSSMLKIAQALAIVGNKGIVAVDDFGEELDAASSQHLASTLRRGAGQVWVTTRRPHVAEAFRPDELIRLARNTHGKRQPYHGRLPSSKHERLAARHRSIQLLPAIASRAVVIVEGPHDRAALSALASRKNEQEGTPLPAENGISLIDAGIADGSGGSSAIPRLADAARELGWRTLVIIDYDAAGRQAEAELKAILSSADAVIRLPQGHAIELALLVDLDEGVIRAALQTLKEAFGVPLPSSLGTLRGSVLRQEASKVIKHSPGLHAQFIEILPVGVYPPLANLVLEMALKAVVEGKTGLIQL